VVLTVRARSEVHVISILTLLTIVNSFYSSTIFVESGYSASQALFACLEFGAVKLSLPSTLVSVDGIDDFSHGEH
jgi:hypothetical protein